MTPEERRAKYPLPETTWKPMSDDELADLRRSTQDWLDHPQFTARDLDRVYVTYSRLLETIDEWRP